MFAGTGTAIVTPFDRYGEIDEDALRRLVDFQEENGVDVLVPCGSTGESATLSHEEHIHVIEIVRDQSKRCRILAGTGSNCTSEAVDLSKKAADLGVDGILSITPYYNKPTQEGLYKHYEQISRNISCPVIVYNIPGRTGCNVNVDTLMALAELPGIAGVKEASGNMTQIQSILARRPEGFEVLSGDDSITVPLISLGADGVISVAANCCPGLMSDMVGRARKGEFNTAMQLHNELFPLFNALFCETNPIPIKYVMSRMGYGTETPRLPLTPLSGKGRAIVEPVMRDLGLL